MDHEQWIINKYLELINSKCFVWIINKCLIWINNNCLVWIISNCLVWIINKCLLWIITNCFVWIIIKQSARSWVWPSLCNISHKEDHLTHFCRVGQNPTYCVSEIKTTQMLNFSKQNIPVHIVQLGLSQSLTLKSFSTTTITTHHHRTNFSKGSRPNRSLRFDM